MWRLIAVVALTSACSVSQLAEDATGEEIYQQLCSNCHDHDLSGRIGPPLGPGSNAAGRPDLFLEITIMEGRGRMPSFSSSLNEAQLDRLIRFIREVQAG